MPTVAPGRQGAPSRATRRRQRQLQALRTPSTYCPQVDVLVASRGGADHFHEWVHCLDHGATGYGHVVNWVTVAFAHGWGRLFADFRAEGWAVPCPLECMFDADTAALAVAASGCDEAHAVRVGERLAAAAFSHDVLSGLLEVFDGIEPLAGQDQVTAASGLGLLERFCERDATLAESADLLEALPVWEVPEAASPRVRWAMDDSDVSYPELGARALMEGRAMMVEGALHADPNSGPRSAIAGERLEYVLAPMLVADRLGQLGDVGEGVLFTTFMALSDLALMTPLASPYAALRTDRRYRDVHPGYRFVALLELLPELGPFDDGLDPFTYQRAFSERLGWPDAREMLALGAAIDSPRRRFARHRMCCERKLARPELFLLGGPPGDLEAFAQLLQAMAPLECVAESDGRVTPVLADDDAQAVIEQVAESYLFDLGEALMCDPAPLAAAFGWMAPFERGVRVSDGTGLRELLQAMLVRDLAFVTV